MVKPYDVKKSSKSKFSVLVVIITLILGLVAGTDQLSDDNPLKQLAQVVTNGSNQEKVNSNGSSANESTPNQDLAQSVLTSSVRKSLGDDIKWNGAGAFVINNNKTNLDASVSSMPYVDNKIKRGPRKACPVSSKCYAV